MTELERLREAHEHSRLKQFVLQVQIRQWREELAVEEARFQSIEKAIKQQQQEQLK